MSMKNAWAAVVRTLDEVDPMWNQKDHSKTPIELAVEKILELARDSKDYEALKKDSFKNAWLSVTKKLDEVSPGWFAGRGKGGDLAAEAIDNLSRPQNVINVSENIERGQYLLGQLRVDAGVDQENLDEIKGLEDAIRLSTKIDATAMESESLRNFLKMQSILVDMLLEKK